MNRSVFRPLKTARHAAVGTSGNDPGRLPGEIDFLGIHFLGPGAVSGAGELWSTACSAGSARRSWRAATSDRRGSGIPGDCRRINEIFGYELTGRPTRCRIGKVRYVQPRQHAVLGHSKLILEQMRRVDRPVRKWLRREFGAAVAHRASGRPRSRGLGAWRVRSAARMYEMGVAAHAYRVIRLTMGCFD